MLLLFCYYFVVVVVVMLLLFSCCCHVAIVTYCCLDCSDKLISEFFYKVADIQTDRATTRGPIGPKNSWACPCFGGKSIIVSTVYVLCL